MSCLVCPHHFSVKQDKQFLIDEILRLKKERNAVILSHNYMTSDIFHTISDIVGDSLYLAQQAVHIKADMIVQCGVHFMAETSKILNPGVRVFIPDYNAGCSLASSITKQNVLDLKIKYPGVPVVTYVNTTAEVKSVSDICCTSGNALNIVNGLDGDRVIMVPDKYLAQNIAKQTHKEIFYWEGACEVHEMFRPSEVVRIRLKYPKAVIIAHPECPPDVVEGADFSGSTAQMVDFVKKEKPHSVILITECSMSDNMALMLPETQFIRLCNLCPHMQKITLPKILNTLQNFEGEIFLEETLLNNARLPIEKMIAFGR